MEDAVERALGAPDVEVLACPVLLPLLWCQQREQGLLCSLLCFGLRSTLGLDPLEESLCLTHPPLFDLGLSEPRGGVRPVDLCQASILPLHFCLVGTRIDIDVVADVGGSTGSPVEP